MKLIPVSAAVLVASVASPSVCSPAASDIIGSARCTKQAPTLGVVCKVPGHPWSVGITKFQVYAWRHNTLYFVRTNR